MTAGGIAFLVAGAVIATAIITWLVVDRFRRAAAAEAVAHVEEKVEAIREGVVDAETKRTDEGAWARFKAHFGR